MNDLYENVALYLDEDTFINFVQINKMVFSFDFWVNKFRMDNLPFIMNKLPVTQKKWIHEYIKIYNIVKDVNRKLSLGNWITCPYNSKIHKHICHNLNDILNGGLSCDNIKMSLNLSTTHPNTKLMLIKIYYFYPDYYKYISTDKETLKAYLNL